MEQLQPRRLFHLLLPLLLFAALGWDGAPPAAPRPARRAALPPQGAGRRAWRAARGPSPATVGGVGLWCPIPGVLQDWWLVTHLLTRAFGVPLVPQNESVSWVGPPPDVLIAGMHADQAEVAAESISARHASLLLFHASEPDAEFSDGLVESVDVSFAFRRDLQHLPHYTALPIFLHTLADRDRAVSLPLDGALCPLHPFLLRGGLMDAGAWFARANYTLLLTWHMPYPRWLMYHRLAELGAVEHPGPLGDIRTFFWCAALNCSEIPNTPRGKVLLLRRFRYSLCPENKHAPGYVTEKLVEAHLAGAVPLYYGDVAAFPDVFNIKRVIVMRDADVDAGGGGFLEQVRQLETNLSRRREFFAEPVLAPTAQAWAEGQCQRAVRSIDAALAALVERQLLARAVAGRAEGWALTGRRRRSPLRGGGGAASPLAREDNDIMDLRVRDIEGECPHGSGCAA